MMWSSLLTSSILTELLPHDWTTTTTMLIQLTYIVAATVFLWVLHYALFRPLNRIRVNELFIHLY